MNNLTNNSFSLCNFKRIIQFFLFFSILTLSFFITQRVYADIQGLTSPPYVSTSCNTPGCQTTGTSCDSGYGVCVWDDGNGGATANKYNACQALCSMPPSCSAASGGQYIDDPNAGGLDCKTGANVNPYRCCMRNPNYAPTQYCSGTSGYCTIGNYCRSGYILDDTYQCPGTNNCCRPTTCYDLPLGTNSYCTRTGHNCNNGTTADYNTLSSWCDINTPGGLSICCENIQACNGGTSCNSCQDPGNHPANSCGTGNFALSCTNTTYTNCSAGYDCQPHSNCNQNSYSNGNCQYSWNWCNGGAGYTCYNGNACLTNIFVHVIKDYNHDGIQNGNDSGLGGVTVTDNGGNYPQTDGNGNVMFGLKGTGNYSISVFVPGGYTASSATTVNGTLTNNSGNQNVYFYVTPLYSISGSVFSDTNKNQRKDGSEGGISGMTVRITGNGVNTTTNADGSGNYSFGNLLSGTYTVAVASALPAGYQYTTTSSWTITVGDRNGSPACNTSTSPDAGCGNPQNGSISNLNFGATNENPHYQGVCLDMRNDNNGGTFQDLMPAPGATCGGVNGSVADVTNGSCSTGAGILYSCNGTFDFGLGSSNTNNWQAGGAGANQECYSGPGLNVIATSYDYMMTTAQESNITPTDMATVCGGGGLNNCTLDSNLQKGIYRANGDVYLNAYTFPGPADPNTGAYGYILLINGNLHIQGNIIIPKGSVAAFSASGNIYVDKSVGQIITNTSSTSNNNPNLEGIYSSDGSFIVQSFGSGTSLCNADGTPLDKKLNILGIVITNASKNGGTLVNNRDLCVYDTSCSSISIGDGNTGSIDPVNGNDQGLLTAFLLTLYEDGAFVNRKHFTWQEVKP